MNIGISGASGHVGRAVLAQVTRSTHTPVAISRTPGPGGRLGDFDRPDTLPAAYAGLDRLLLIPGTDLRPGVLGDQLVAAIDAAIAAGVGHLVLLSSVASSTRTGSSLGDSYRRAEERVRLAPRWTIVRMGYFAETLADEARRAGVLVGLGDSRVALVARDDIAAAAASVLLGEGHEGATYDLTGPRSLSGPERAAAVSAAAGRPVAFALVTEEALRGQLGQAGLPPFLVDAVVSMQRSFVAGDYATVADGVERLTGRAPRALGDT